MYKSSIEKKPTNPTKKLNIYTNSITWNNPKKAAYAYICTKNGEIFHKKSRTIGQTTKNRAEYKAIILALKNTEINKKTTMYSNNEFIIKQIRRQKITHPYLKPLHNKVQNIKQKNKEIKFEYLNKENKYIQKTKRLLKNTIKQKN